MEMGPKLLHWLCSCVSRSVGDIGIDFTINKSADATRLGVSVDLLAGRRALQRGWTGWIHGMGSVG